MIQPDIDGRLALRLREMVDNPHWPISQAEKDRIIHLTADLLEEYIMAYREKVA